MRSAARAIAWEFRQKQRWGLIALAVNAVFVGGLSVVRGPGYAIAADGGPNEIAILLLVPLTITFLYFLAVFSFGLAGDLAARQSMYPARMFTLPVSTSALAGWPMVYGAIAMTILWFTSAVLVRWSGVFELPWMWPGVLAVAFLAWTQVLTWMPYGLPGLRVVLALLWLPVLDAIVIVAFHYQISEPVMIAFLAPQIPLAYLAARFAVGRARRGEVPDWREAFARLGGIANVFERRGAFPSAASAQAWLEGRRHGLALPVWVAILLPFELSLLFVDPPAFLSIVLYTVLLTPPLMASFAALTVSRDDLSPFLATRPLTSAGLVAAKLRMTMRSTLAAWLPVFVATPLALMLSGNWPLVADKARRVSEVIGVDRAIVIAVLLLAGLVVLTWKQLVQSFFIGLTGREWLIKGSGFLVLLLLIALLPLLEWIGDSKFVQAVLWDSLSWILATLACLKIAAAGWIAVRLHGCRLLSDRALIAGAAWWCAAVLVLFGVLVVLIGTPLIPRYFLALVAILAIPLARLSAAPLALAWNRHR